MDLKVFGVGRRRGDPLADVQQRLLPDARGGHLQRVLALSTIQIQIQTPIQWDGDRRSHRSGGMVTRRLLTHVRGGDMFSVSYSLPLSPSLRHSHLEEAGPRGVDPVLVVHLRLSLGRFQSRLTDPLIPVHHVLRNTSYV